MLRTLCLGPLPACLHKYTAAAPCNTHSFNQYTWRPYVTLYLSLLYLASMGISYVTVHRSSERTIDRSIHRRHVREKDCGCDVILPPTYFHTRTCLNRTAKQFMNDPARGVGTTCNSVIVLAHLSGETCIAWNSAVYLSYFRE